MTPSPARSAASVLRRTGRKTSQRQHRLLKHELVLLCVSPTVTGRLCVLIVTSNRLKRFRSTAAASRLLSSLPQVGSILSALRATCKSPALTSLKSSSNASGL
jgi:hypothetical protein